MTTNLFKDKYYNRGKTIFKLKQNIWNSEAFMICFRLLFS